MNLCRDLVIDSIEQVQLAIQSGEDPEGIVLPGNGCCRIKRRRRFLLSNAGHQRAREEISNGREESRNAQAFGFEGPGIVALLAIHVQSRTAADQPGEKCVKQMIFAQKYSAPQISWQSNWSFDRQRLPRQ